MAKDKIIRPKITHRKGKWTKKYQIWRVWRQKLGKKRKYYGISKQEELLNLRSQRHIRGVRRPVKKRVRGEIGRKVLKARLEKRILKPKVKRFKVKRVRRPQKIEGVFKKAISKMVIADILPIATSQINNQYKRLFRNVIRDKDIMNLMIVEENIQKIKHRFEIRASIYGLRGEKLAEISKGEGGSLMELRSLMEGKIWKGQNMEGTDMEGLKDFGQGYVYHFLQKGNVNRVETVIVFRS